jgi:hypothetical protein
VVFKTKDLEAKYWGACVGFGFLSLPMGVVIRLLPDGVISWAVSKKKKVVPEDSSESSRLLPPTLDETSRVEAELKVFKAVRGTARLDNGKRPSKVFANLGSDPRGSRQNLRASASELRASLVKSVTSAPGHAIGTGNHTNLSSIEKDLAMHGFQTEPVKLEDHAIPRSLHGSTERMFNASMDKVGVSRSMMSKGANSKDSMPINKSVKSLVSLKLGSKTSLQKTYPETVVAETAVSETAVAETVIAEAVAAETVVAETAVSGSGTVTEVAGVTGGVDGSASRLDSEVNVGPKTFAPSTEALKVEVEESEPLIGGQESRTELQDFEPSEEVEVIDEEQVTEENK